MKLLLLMEYVPISANYNGAAARYAQNLQILHQLGHEVHIVRVYDAKSDLAPIHAWEAQSPQTATVQAQVQSWHSIAYHDTTPKGWRYYAQQLFNPTASTFPARHDLRQALPALIAQLQPDLLWIERIQYASAVAGLKLDIPWLLSEHDILHHLYQIRYPLKTWRQRLKYHSLKQAEAHSIAQIPLILTGSQTDKSRLQALGAQNVQFIPIAYDTQQPTPTQSPRQPVTITHLGSLETTANRVGLQAYLERAHPTLQGQLSDVRLQIVGDASRVQQPLKGYLEQAGVDVLGYVADLGTALQPFDITILPYEFDSGYRTKLPLLLDYAQVVVTTRAAISGMYEPALADVCYILDSLDDFPKALIHLANHPQERQRLGLAAQTYYRQHYTLTAVQAQYQRLLEIAQQG